MFVLNSDPRNAKYSSQVLFRVTTAAAGCSCARTSDILVGRVPRQGREGLGGKEMYCEQETSIDGDASEI
jgi:hypothetical protein